MTQAEGRHLQRLVRGAACSVWAAVSEEAGSRGSAPSSSPCVLRALRGFHQGGDISPSGLEEDGSGTAEGDRGGRREEYRRSMEPGAGAQWQGSAPWQGRGSNATGNQHTADGGPGRSWTGPTFQARTDTEHGDPGDTD